MSTSKKIQESTMVILVSIPHHGEPTIEDWPTRAAFEEAMIATAHGMDSWSWEEWTKQSAEECYGEDGDMPEALAAALEKHGTVIEVNGDYLSPQEAGSEIDWAIEAVGSNYRGMSILTAAEAVEFAMRELGRPEADSQRDRAAYLMKGLLGSWFSFADLPEELWDAEDWAAELEAKADSEPSYLVVGLGYNQKIGCSQVCDGALVDEKESRDRRWYYTLAEAEAEMKEVARQLALEDHMLEKVVVFEYADGEPRKIVREISVYKEAEADSDE